MFHKELNELFYECCELTQKRPFDINGFEDGDYSYIHQSDCMELIKKAYKLGHLHGRTGE